ncbi:MAG: RluA family pseudouridine synthase [Alphaproteobacteria bacterium]
MATEDNGSAFRLHVTEERSDIRLDKWLAGEIPSLSRSRLKALIEEGRVSADGRTIDDPACRVKIGQSVMVVVPEATPAEPVAQAIGLVVVYEDEDVIVIDKPAGMVVHPAPGNPDATLVNALLAHCGDSLSGVGGIRRPGIVHRIDKDTSGLLVAAKSDRAHHGLASQFAEHSIDRAYTAVVWGVPTPGQGRIEGNIGRSSTDRKKMTVVRQGGRHALTHYRVIKAFGRTASVVECRLATGRTHQIRVHMRSIGHPLVGDPVYGRNGRGSPASPGGADVALRTFPRQALHAHLIGFVHPLNGNKLRFESTIPNDIKALIGELERYQF